MDCIFRECARTQLAHPDLWFQTRGPHLHVMSSIQDVCADFEIAATPVPVNLEILGSADKSWTPGKAVLEDRNKVLDSFVPLAEGMMGTPTAPGCAAGCNLPVSGSLSTWMLWNGGSGEGGQGGHVLRVLWPVTNCIIACACHGWVWVLLWCLKRYCQEKEKKLKKQLVLFRQCENRF